MSNEEVPRVVVWTKDDSTTFIITGEVLGSECVPQLKDEVSRIIDNSSIGRVVINCINVNRLDINGAGFLAAASERLGGSRLELTNTEEINNTLEFVGLTKLTNNDNV